MRVNVKVSPNDYVIIMNTVVSILYLNQCVFEFTRE